MKKTITGARQSGRSTMLVMAIVDRMKMLDQNNIFCTARTLMQREGLRRAIVKKVKDEGFDVCTDSNHATIPGRGTVTFGSVECQRGQVYDLIAVDDFDLFSKDDQASLICFQIIHDRDLLLVETA